MNQESCVNEAVLIEGIKNGERASFDQIVKMYQQKGIGIAYGMVGNLEDAKDILQEAFIKVYTQIKSFRGQSCFSTWFYRIVVNSSIDFLRRKKRGERIFVRELMDGDSKPQELQAPDLRYEPAKVVINAELSGRLDECVEALPEKQKACFILKHREGLTSSQIAEVLNCRLSTVKVHLFRATRTLQNKLAAYFIK